MSEMNCSESLSSALKACEDGSRLTREQGLALLEKADFLTLGRLAHKARLAHNPEPRVTYVVDRNINTTNICTSGCKFCAFFTPPQKNDGYVLTHDQIALKIEETKALGGTQILMQGGLHPEIGARKTAELFSFIKQYHPIKIHGLSPPEVVHMARVDGLSVEDALDLLIQAGLDSIPGGGAEILVDRVRSKVAPNKCDAEKWLQVMALAHEKGLLTTATMMFGHVESLDERILHLDRLRSLQDNSLAQNKGHFTAFIPWTFQPANTALAHVRKATAMEYLRMLAVSRLYLDNFDHVQASWVTQGDKIAQLALLFGADDLGSTMIEENVVKAAGAIFRLGREQMIRLAKNLGFEACQRNTDYTPVRP
jgi:cyclic dehypoxanthinyl futalosine synthase